MLYASAETKVVKVKGALMTIEELEKQIASLQEEVRKLKEIKSAEPWRAVQGEWYYCIDSDGSGVKALEDYSDVHLHRFQFGNYYRAENLLIRTQTSCVLETG